MNKDVVEQSTATVAEEKVAEIPVVDDDNMTIRIACEGAGLADLDDLKPLQGGLKTLSHDDYEKLKASILRHGVSFPLFVWRDNGDMWTIDGHQRDRVLGRMREEGYAVPKLPVDYIHATDRKEALEKILLVSSQYGKITGDTLYQFLGENELELDDLRGLLEFPNLDMKAFERAYFAEAPESFRIADPATLPTEWKCPKCGYEWSGKAK